MPGLDALLAAMTSRINANAALTARQAAMIAAKEHLDAMINGHTTFAGTGMGWAWRTSWPMGRMWR